MIGSEVRRLAMEAIETGVTPGIAYAIGSSEGCTIGCYGKPTRKSRFESIDIDTLWDLASLTKVVGTTTAAMCLYDSGSLDLDQRADEALPELQGHGREKIKIRNLLLHDSGLPASFRPDQLGDVRSALASQELVYETETDTIYSDVGFIALGWILERLSGKPLPQLFQERIFLPLGMTQTGFCPHPKLRAQCAPTEFRDGETIQGRVHDPTAAAMGGVAGHAGLFSTIGDMARFGAEQLVEGRRLFSPETFADFTGDCPAINGRLLGWQAASPGSSAGNRLDPHSFGHTGFTGTSIWVDLAANLFVVLLTNRTYPTAENLKVRDFRIAFHDAAFDEFGNTPRQV